MNDIWNFFENMGGGLEGALNTVSLFRVLIVSLLIGLLLPVGRYTTKALLAVAIVLGIQIFWPMVDGGRAALPDLRHIGPLLEIALMYIFAFGVIGVIGALRSGFKAAAKA